MITKVARNMPEEDTLRRFTDRGGWSTCVASASYDPLLADLVIVFQKRGTYVFSGVPPEEAYDFLNATSQGTYFNLYVKDRYSYRRIA